VNIGIVGAGRAGTAIGVLLQRAGHEIVSVSGGPPSRARAARFLPGVPVAEPVDVASSARLVIIAVPDDRIEPVVSAMAGAGAFGHGPWVAHVSGATPLAALGPARAAGGRVLGLHPFQTFPDPQAGIDRIPGCTIAIAADDEEGFTLVTSLARDLGGRSFRLADEDRARYHAAAVFASNDVVAASAVAEDLLSLAGVPDPRAAMRPLQEATVANIATLGPGEALTGPAVRGDAGTIERHLDALARDRPTAVRAYVAMARLALDLAIEAGRLDDPGRAAVEEVLDRWT
jgi:predicted short-subunit dehydrogenase-like oxidoreductase (DUF2520 family)